MLRQHNLNQCGHAHKFDPPWLLSIWTVKICSKISRITKLRLGPLLYSSQDTIQWHLKAKQCGPTVSCYMFLLYHIRYEELASLTINKLVSFQPALHRSSQVFPGLPSYFWWFTLKLSRLVGRHPSGSVASCSPAAKLPPLRRASTRQKPLVM